MREEKHRETVKTARNEEENTPGGASQGTHESEIVRTSSSEKPQIMGTSGNKKLKIIETSSSDETTIQETRSSYEVTTLETPGSDEKILCEIHCNNSDKHKR